MPRTQQTAPPGQAAKAKSAGVAKPEARRRPSFTGVYKPADSASASANAASAEVIGNGGSLSRKLHGVARGKLSRVFRDVRAGGGAVDLEALPAVLDKLDDIAALVQGAYVKEKFKGEEFCAIWSKELDCKLMLEMHEDEPEYNPKAEPHFTLVDEAGDFSEECKVSSSAHGTFVYACGYGSLHIRGLRDYSTWGDILWEFTPSLKARDTAVILREEGKEARHCR